MSGSKVISDNCHVLELALWTNAYQEHFLGRVFSECRRFRNDLAGNAMHRIMRLRQDLKYRSLLETFSSLKKSGIDASSQLKEIRGRLSAIRTIHGLASRGQFEKLVSPTRNSHYNTTFLQSHVAQTIAADVWAGVEKILYSNGKDLSIKGEHEFLSIRGKSNETAIVFNPVQMSVRVGKHIIPVSGGVDEYQKTDLAKIRASFLSEKNGYGPLPGCIRFNRIIRMLVNDHGCIKWGYWLQVTADGPAPKSNFARKHTVNADRSGRTLAIDPSQTMMSCCTSDGNAFFLLLDGKNPQADMASSEVSVRLDQSRRASNPERYNPDGTYRKGSVNAWTGKKSDWNSTPNYETLRRRRRLMMQKQGETLRTRRNEMCNNLVSAYSVIKTEGTNYLALSVRSKRMRIRQGGAIASKKRFGETIHRFAPSLFLSTLKQKCESSGGQYVEINPWTLKASQYDPTDGSYTRHKLPHRVFRLSDGTPVQRDLMAALNILCSKKEERKYEKDGSKVKSRRNSKNSTALIDVPDRELLLDSLAWFIPAMAEEMQRMHQKSTKQAIPSAIGVGAWTALLGAGKSEPDDAGDDVDAPNPTGEDTRAVTRGHRERNGTPDTRSTARNQADTKRKALPSCGTPRL